MIEPQESRETEPVPRPKVMLCVLAVVLAAVAVYVNTLWNGFAYDDDAIIVGNARVHQLKDLGLIWGTPYWPTYGLVLGLYRPLAIFAYALEWAVGHGQPWIFHAVNTLLHAGVSALVFLLLRKFFDLRAALLGALVFAVHPIHTEAVANGVGQAELLAAVGVIGACVLYASRPRNAAVPTRQIVALPVLYLLALFSKEAAITLPALLVLLDVAQGRLGVRAPTGPRAHEPMSPRAHEPYLRSVWLLFFLLAATAVLYLCIRVEILGTIGGSNAGPQLPFLRGDRRLLTALRAWPEFVRLLFFPKDLSVNYAPGIILPVQSLTPMTLFGAAILGTTLIIAALTPWHPRVGMPAAWFLITIITVSNLFFPVGVVLAERTLYTPSVAVAMIVAGLWHTLRRRGSPQDRRVGLIVAALALTLMSVRTIQRNPTWHDTQRVLNTLVKEHPESYHTPWVLANHFWRKKDLTRAAYYWEAAIRIWPGDAQVLNEVANFQIGLRNYNRAIELLERSRDINPWYWTTLEHLAYAYALAGRNREAIASANQSIWYDGRISTALAIKAKAYEELGDFGNAVGAWRAYAKRSGNVQWQQQAMLARVLARYGDRSGALAAADSAWQRAANDPTARRAAEQVKETIRSGCYDRSAPPTCTDPLRDLMLFEAVPDIAVRTTVPPPAASGQSR